MESKWIVIATIVFAGLVATILSWDPHPLIGKICLGVTIMVWIISILFMPKDPLERL